MNAQPYSALTNAHFLLTETALVAERLVQGAAWTDLRAEAREGRLFGHTRPASQTTIFTALKGRLNGQPAEILAVLQGGSLEARRLLNLALTVQQRRVLRDFMADVLVSQVRAFDRRVTDADVRRFLGHLADQEPEVAAWSEETTQKTRSNLTRLLQDAGVLQASGRGQYVVLPQYLATPVRTLLDAHFPETLRLLEALR